MPAVKRKRSDKQRRGPRRRPSRQPLGLAFCRRDVHTRRLSPRSLDNLKCGSVEFQTLATPRHHGQHLPVSGKMANPFQPNAGQHDDDKVSRERIESNGEYESDDREGSINYNKEERCRRLELQWRWGLLDTAVSAIIGDAKFCDTSKVLQKDSLEITW
ncbi:hypothetical protein EYF80_007696 [Liparis tanakae]|uniref:Uncharacterized protein n=1 Tax=Liparis tanakae TaxID=230148 RepID=A0A4Z2IVS0_9TELE|nr:hypothetical protein EYF80_007696 [Liparis tanakae]